MFSNTHTKRESIILNGMALFAMNQIIDKIKAVNIEIILIIIDT